MKEIDLNENEEKTIKEFSNFRNTDQKPFIQCQENQ